MKLHLAVLLGAGLLLCATAWADDDDDDYVDIPTDLARGLTLLEVAERAEAHAGDYWETAPRHPDNPRPDADSVEGGDDGDDDGDDEDELLAYEAVGEIWLRAKEMDSVDADARDVVKVVIAAIDAWNEAEDTYGAVKRGVELKPDRAAEIAGAVAIKKDCNVAAGGIWPQQRVEERIRLDVRHAFVDVPLACSCSQAAMFATISGLPEQAEFEAATSDEERARITAAMVEKTNEIIERVAAAQNRNNWDCSCSDVNLAATMRGIEDDDLQDGTWDGLAQRYADEAGDAGLVVDSFGTVGRHPQNAWGSEDINSAQHTLRRNPNIYRGDPLILDPFHPALEWLSHVDNDYSGLQLHNYQHDATPTEIFFSEYIEGWNEEALAKPVGEREPEERNQVIELYNGSDRDIDLGQGQYVLEIYGPGKEGVPVVVPAAHRLERNTITLDSGVTFDLDKWDIRPEASESLNQIVSVLNGADIVSEILIEGHTCDLATDDYNQRLSERRSRSVREYLVNAGLKVDEIRTAGHGEANPEFPNDSEANRSMNRRVEITFVTRGGVEIERTVTAEGGKRHYEFSWLSTRDGEVVADGQPRMSTAVIPLVFGEETFVEGDMEPREVIGLNGQIEAGGTFLIAYDGSDEGITDIADLVTGQLYFNPSDTLLIRRFGGDMAMACKAHGYALLNRYPLEDFVVIGPRIPLIPIIGPITGDPIDDDKGGEKGSGS